LVRAGSSDHWINGSDLLLSQTGGIYWELRYAALIIYTAMPCLYLAGSW